ncbi:NADP-dependent oxidoreductase [Enhydrobacter sp.]|uniref:NADP-dependent oxidoreductase n=1 Tax=Enhydrobacter sp. TaxID=1894999 RepID=UPI002626B4DC|nr:NADP-dependent oxidoreductase [Enhydrobacter sp.]WIM11730.1 MAG: Putative oxidoreductase YncB [Enhydrobacter sp.]
MTDALQIVLAKRPVGDVNGDCFRQETVAIPALAEGQILVRQRFLSLDPYMRPRMSELHSYTPPFEVGKPLTGGSVGEVVDSRNDRFAKGDTVIGMLNWATHTVHDGKGLRKIDPAVAPLPAHLGVLGMPSFTAWYGMKHICKPKAGETAFVSAATGAVGQVAGQLARLAGAKVVGCAGGEDKCVWAVREAGYDACFNHRTERDYGAVLDRLCPQGIDADFENVGGPIFHAVFARLNNFGRVAFCGAISEYQDKEPMAGPPKMFTIVQRRLTLQGFIISDHTALMGEFVNEVGGLLKAGRLKSRETIVEGLARAPQAFMGLLKGENFGKLVVKIDA